MSGLSIIKGIRLTSFCVLCLMFPWIGSASNQFDTQPWVIIICFLFMISRGSLPKVFSITLFFSIIVIFCNEVYWGFSFDSVRSISELIIFSISFFIGFIIIKEKYFGLIIVGNVIYLAAAIVQLFFDANIFDFLVEARSSPTRGLTSLTPEPTFFGMVLCFFSIILIQRRIASSYVRALLIFNIVFILFVAKSFTAFSFLLFIVMYFCFIKWPIRGLGFSAFFLFMFVYSFSVFDLGRISSLSNSIVASPSDLIEHDFSAKVRISDSISWPFMLVYNDGAPVASTQISTVREAAMKDVFSGMFFYRSSVNRTNTWLASLMLKLSVIGLLLVVILIQVRGRHVPKSIYPFVIGIGLFSFPEAVPILGIAVGSLFGRDEF